MKKFLLLFYVLTIWTAWTSVPVLSQDTDSQIGFPELIVKNKSTQEPLALTRFSAEVTINGVIAETKMTMTFFNPHSRNLEGDFNFPLPEGSFISGYALDINGKMVDGVVVEKQEGRVVFEKIVRQGIDPGLVEWVAGNNFRTRVFPIPPKGSRTISVRYLTEIVIKNQKPCFFLPLDVKRKLDRFSLRVEVLQTDVEPKITQGKPANFTFSHWYSGFKAETSLKEFLPPGDLVIALPESRLQEVRVEKSKEGDVYFHIYERTGAAKKLKASKAQKPRHITILWDVSSSMGTLDHRVELQLLTTYLSSLKTKNITVDLIFFHHKREEPRRFTIEKGKKSINTLINTIKDIQYDGATDLAAILSSEAEPVPDVYLLFSDGVSNFGKEGNDRFNALKAPVYSFSSSSRANHVSLRYLSHQTGGTYFNLNQVDEKTVLNRMGNAPYSFISTSIDNGSVSDIYPRRAQPVYDRFSLVGKLLSQRANITLNYGINGRVMKRVSYMVSRKYCVQGNRLRTYWAQKKITWLQVFPEQNREELVNTGKKYGLVTPGTSLIVLDNLQQYLEHEIMPPESLPKMRGKYIAALKKKKQSSAKKQEKNLEKVVQLWKERLNWWKTSFPIQSFTTRSKEDRSRDVESRENIPVAAVRARSPQYIYGKIVLEDGSPIPGVLITVIGIDSDFRAVTITDMKGNYAIGDDILPGDYDVKAELEGFKTIVRRGIRLSVGSSIKVDLVLGVGTIMEEVVITSSVPAADTRASQTGTNVNKSTFDGITIHDGEVRVKEVQAEPSPAPGLAISLKEWNPKTPYLDGLKESGPEAAYTVYLKQKELYGNAPSFYLDSADYFFEAGKKNTGLRILSNIAEMDLENPALLRVLGHSLARLGYLELGALIFEKVLKLRPEEPQSYRDLALVLAQQQKYTRAVKLLYHVVTHRWDRFDQIELIALMELNNILRKVGKTERTSLEEKIDPRLIAMPDLDIRIVLTWDADMTDMDLWVLDPTGEKSYYGHKLSWIGGIMSRDFTGGYGPEEYVLKKAVKGGYNIQVNYFGSSAAKLLGPVTLQVDIFTDYGRESEKRKSITLRLKEKKEVIRVGSIEK